VLHFSSPSLLHHPIPTHTPSTFLSPSPLFQVCKAVCMKAIKRCKHFEIGGEKKNKNAAY